MNIEYYQNFVKVVEAGTISAASRQLLIAQPALSNQIKALERNYGAQLLIRNARYLTLTDSGKILYDKVKSMLLMEDFARKEIASCVLGNRGTLWLGLSEALPDSQITSLLLDFSDTYPEITYEIYETTTDELRKLLKNEIVEIAIFRTHGDSYPLIGSAFTTQELLMAVYRRDNPWLSEELESIPISALKDVPLSISKGLRHIVTSACTAAGFSPEFKAVTSSRMASLLWSQRAKAVTILPVRLISDYENEEYCCRPFENKQMHINRSFNYLRDHNFSTVAQLFLQFCQTRLATP